MPAAEIAVRAKRKLTNRLIAARDAQRLRAHFTEDLIVIVGDGGAIYGADAVVAAFTQQFADPAFISYVRTTQTIEFHEDGRRAAEAGGWVGAWKGSREMKGTYLAAWRLERSQWLLDRELYITLVG